MDLDADNYQYVALCKLMSGKLNGFGSVQPLLEDAKLLPHSNYEPELVLLLFPT